MIQDEKLQNISHDMCGSSKLFEKRIWTIEDVCNFTSFKMRTIYNKVNKGEIPYRKCGRKLFFIPSEVLSWVTGGTKT